MKNINYKAFKLVSKHVLANQSGMVESTLATWTKTKPEAVRILEYSVYFNIFDEATVELLSAPDLTLFNALKLVGAEKVSIAEITKLTGVLKGSLYNWWGGAENKRLLSIKLIQGVVTILAIAKKEKLYRYWPVTEQEKLLSGNTKEINITPVLEKAFQLWLSE